MLQSLQRGLDIIRRKASFCPEFWIQSKIKLLNTYMRENKLNGCVINLSGGIDSSTVFALCLAAQRVDQSPINKIMGVYQPINSSAKFAHHVDLCRCLITDKNTANIITVDQSDIFEKLSTVVYEASGITGGVFATGQLKSYMRTPVADYISQLLTQEGCPSIVMGTGNYDEDGYLRYFCKAGDGISDVQIIADLHKSQVKTIASYMGVPHPIINTKPSADLWDGQTDEDELGFSYDFVELLTTYHKFSSVEQEEFYNSLDEESRNYFNEKRLIAERVALRNKHKEIYPIDLNL